MENQSYPFSQFLKDIIGLIKPYRKKFWAGVLFRLSSDIAHLFPPFAVARIVSILTENPNPDSAVSQIGFVLIIWLSISIYLGFGENLGRYFGYQVAENAGLDLYKKTLSHIHKLDLSWQELENSGNKMKRIERGRDGVNELIRKFYDVIIPVLINTVGIFFIFFTLDKMVGLMTILFAVTFVVIGTILLRRAVRQEEIVNKKFEDLGGITFESLNNVQTIKSLSIEKGVGKSVENKSNILVWEIKKRIFLFRRQAGFLESYFHISETLIASYIIWGIINGRYEISFLVIFIGLFIRVGEATDDLVNAGQQIVIGKIWVSRAMHVLKTKPVIENAEIVKTQVPYPLSWKTISLKNINFKYGKKTVLDNISLTINRNESIGIVGLSGAGKSTLFKLLLDLYENYDGDILLDRISLKNIKRDSYIENIAVVLQDTELFNMTLSENIEIAGNTPKDQGKLEEVIKMSHLTDVVENLPQGANTLVGEKGIKLSGGQRQRLGIARALYRDPDILFLDEATSHLDGFSEKQIQKAIAENIHKFTTIVIAHRLSTIKEMDKIVVLEKGKIVERGTFDELIEKKGYFARMWQEQKL
jgi:ATP-binding cassette, subfamily B, heavy metal transporter